MVTGVLKNKVQALYFTKEGTEAAEGKGPAGGHRDREDWPLASVLSLERHVYIHG